MEYRSLFHYQIWGPGSTGQEDKYYIIYRYRDDVFSVTERLVYRLPDSFRPGETND